MRRWSGYVSLLDFDCRQTHGQSLMYSGGFELLAALLRPKMPLLVDIACTKIILHMLGINMDKPM